MKIIYKYISITLLLLSTFSYTRDSHLSQIKYESELNIKVHKHKTERGISILNNKYSLNSTCFFVYNKNSKNWYKKSYPVVWKTSKFRPVFRSMEAPFIFTKEKNENYFYIIKKNDTLKFELKDF